MEVQKALSMHSMSGNVGMWKYWPFMCRNNSTTYEHDVSYEKKKLLVEDHASSTNATVGFKWIGTFLTSILSLLWILIPRQGRPANPKAPHQLHPMAYLDALRGYLALIIYTRHFMPMHYRWIPDWIIATPGLSFPFRGAAAALNIFFFISGYVITFKSVGLIQTKQYSKLIDALASAIFRRYLRLFLPVLGTSLFTLILVKLGIALPPKFKVQDLKGNLITYYIRDSIKAIDPFSNVAGWRIDVHKSGCQFLDHFWSIRTEFRSSMMLYLFCAGTCKLSTSNRKRLIWLCIPIFTYWQSTWAAMALLGMWFGERRRGRARQQEMTTLVTHTTMVEVPQSLSDGSTEISQINRDAQKSTARGKLAHYIPSYKHLQGRFVNMSSRIETPSKLRESALVAMFLYSFVVMHDPYSVETSTRFAPTVLRAISPHHWDPMMKMFFQMMVGSFFMLYPLDLLPILQKPLLTPFSQYLGELSFGIYAVQYTVAWTIFDRYLRFVQHRYGKQEFDYFWRLFPGYFVMTIALLWTSDLFRRFDMRVVKLCATLEKRFFESK